MFQITFEFVGGPIDGEIVRAQVGEQDNAEDRLILNQSSRIGECFIVTSDGGAQAHGGSKEDASQAPQQYCYQITDRREQDDLVWVQAEYIPENNGRLPSEPRQQSTPGPESLGGQLLVASANVVDPLFSYSVVLVLHQSDEETFGVVLNCPTTATVHELLEGIAEPAGMNSKPVYVGGMADGVIALLHSDASAADLTIAEGICLSVDKRNIERILQQETPAQRLFLGAVSWDSGQLKQEINTGMWSLLPATRELVFSAAEDQWGLARQHLHHRFLRSLGLKHVGANPEVN